MVGDGKGRVGSLEGGSIHVTHSAHRISSFARFTFLFLPVFIYDVHFVMH